MGSWTISSLTDRDRLTDVLTPTLHPSTMQCTLGGFEELQSMKAEKRAILGLPPLPEDSIKVIRNMRAASPPASASDLIEQQQKRGRREHKVRALRSP